MGHGFPGAHAGRATARVLSIVGEAGGQPTVRGHRSRACTAAANTTATLATAAAFAYGARVFAVPERRGAQELRGRARCARARVAYDVGRREPGRHLQEQRQPRPARRGLGSGQQETDDDGRAGAQARRGRRSCFAATGDADLPGVRRRELQAGAPDRLRQLRRALGRAGRRTRCSSTPSRGRDAGVVDRDSRRATGGREGRREPGGDRSRTAIRTSRT